MRHPPPKIKNPTVRVESHGGEPNLKTDSTQTSANGHATTELLSSWNIPPDDHDGVAITIGGKGHIVLTQHRPFMDEVAIVLHPTEARAVLEILPDAIAAADEQRKGAA